MVTSAETRETNRNGKRSRGSSPSPANNNNASSKPPAAVPVDDLTPETSDDDSRKCTKVFPVKSLNLRKSLQTQRRTSAGLRVERANSKVSGECLKWLRDCRRDDERDWRDPVEKIYRFCGLLAVSICVFFAHFMSYLNSSRLERNARQFSN